VEVKPYMKADVLCLTVVSLYIRKRSLTLSSSDTNVTTAN
jgi:hypothetical protein